MLRWVFVFLVLANVIIAALFYENIASYFGLSVKNNQLTTADGSDLVITADERQQGKQSQVIKAQEVTAVQAEDSVCIEISGFADVSDVRKVAQWLKDQGLFAQERTRVVVTEQVFRAYVNNFNTRAQAEEGLRVLQRTTGTFAGSVVYQYGPDDWRISLGLFSDEQQAQNYRDVIKRQTGGLDVEVGVQTKSREQSYLILREATGKQFLRNYQQPQWQQTLLQYRLQVDQCLLR